jgi:signal transduction histidine kinase
MLRDESNPGGESGPRAAAVTPIVLVVGAGPALADLARTLGDAGYPVITVPHARQLAGLAAGGILGPVVLDLATCDPAVVEWLRRAVAAAGGLVIGVRADLDERERRRLRRRFGLFAIHDPRDGLEHFLDLVDTAVDVGRDQHRRRAEHAVRVNLLAKLCHDLRSNLNVINGYADVLGEDVESPATARGALAGLRKASRQSHELVETYSALAHCDSEHMEDRREIVDVRKVVAALRRHVEIRARYAPCALLVDPAPPAAVHTDREKLHAMLTHLVDAALKRSPQATVALGVATANGLVVFNIASIVGDEPFDAGAATEPLRHDGAEELFETPDQILAVTIAQRFGQLLGATVETRSTGTSILFRVALPFAPVVLRAVPARAAR